MPPRTSLCSTASRSTCSNKTKLPNEVSTGKDSKPVGTMTTCYIYSAIKMRLPWTVGPAGVFSNPGMSLKGEFEAGSFGRLLFGMISYIARGRLGGGNVGIGFIDFQGLWEGRKTALLFSGLSINRHFHGLILSPPTVKPQSSFLHRPSFARTASG